MNITGKKRIIVVEDLPSLRRDFVDDIRKHIPDIEIDEAGSEEAALESIRNRTYHVAVLDIMLTEEKGHRGGLNVLDALVKMKEGTLAIMLSATPDINCAIHAIRSRIVIDYVHKSELLSEIEILTNPIREGLRAAHIPVFGKYRRLTAYLSAPEDLAIWEYNAMTAVSTVGFDPLNNALSDLFRNIAPVLHLKKNKKEGTPALAVDKGQEAIHGTFWSKGLGHAIAVCLWTVRGSPIVPEGATEREDIPVKEGKYLQGAIWRVPLGRDEFIEDIWEV
jgi:ActR/RegA family two-component response regulator